MKFTKEAWENAPEGARLEWSVNVALWEEVGLIGFLKDGAPVIEDHGQARATTRERLRIVRPKRKVTVQLWRHVSGSLETKWIGGVWNPNADWTLLDEHTFEIEGE